MDNFFCGNQGEISGVRKWSFWSFQSVTERNKDKRKRFSPSWIFECSLLTKLEDFRWQLKHGFMSKWCLIFMLQNAESCHHGDYFHLLYTGFGGNLFLVFFPIVTREAGSPCLTVHPATSQTPQEWLRKHNTVHVLHSLQVPKDLLLVLERRVPVVHNTCAIHADKSGWLVVTVYCPLIFFISFIAFIHFLIFFSSLLKGYSVSLLLQLTLYFLITCFRVNDPNKLKCTKGTFSHTISYRYKLEMCFRRD